MTDGDEDMSSGDESVGVVEVTDQVMPNDEAPTHRLDVKLSKCVRAPLDSKEIHILPELCQYVAGAQVRGFLNRSVRV